MRIPTQLPPFPNEQLNLAQIQEQLVYLSKFVRDLRRLWDGGNIGFGDGTTRDNIFGAWVSYTTNGVANTEDAVTHNLGVVPIGWLEFSRDKASRLYKSGTAWTTTQIFLKCDVATVAMVIFVVGPSSQAF